MKLRILTRCLGFGSVSADLVRRCVRCQGSPGRGAADCATVLFQGLVADVVQTVLDGTPMLVGKAQQSFSIRLLSRQRRDVVDHFSFVFAVHEAFANHATHLLHPASPCFTPGSWDAVSAVLISLPVGRQKCPLNVRPTSEDVITGYIAHPVFVTDKRTNRVGILGLPPNGPGSVSTI